MLLFISLTSDQIKTVWKYFEILLESQVFCGPSIIIFFVLFCGQENVTGEMILASSGGKRCMVIGKWYRLQWHNDTQRETGGKSGWEKADERPDGVVLPYNKGKLTQHTEASGKCGLWVSCPHTPFSPSLPDLQSPVYRVTTLPVIAEDVVRAARDVWENVFGIVFFSVVSYLQSQSSRPPFYMVFFTSSFLLINLFDFLLKGGRFKKM